MSKFKHYQKVRLKKGVKIIRRCRYKIRCVKDLINLMTSLAWLRWSKLLSKRIYNRGYFIFVPL